MSYRNARWVALGQKQGGVFSGAYVDNTQNLYLQENFSPYLRNARLLGNSITIRPGHTAFKTLTSGSTPKGIGTYRYVNGDYIVVRHNQSGTEKLVKIDESATLTAITTTGLITSDNRMEFVNVGDVVYCMNGVDNFGRLKDSTYTTPTTGVDEFTPEFGVVFNSSLWVAGISGFEPAYLTGGAISNYTLLVSGLQSVSNGGFKITIDGTLYDITGLDFTSISSGAAGLGQAVAIVQSAIQSATGSTETFVWTTTNFSTGTGYITISSVDTTIDSSISVTSAPSTGTDIGTNGFFKTELGTVTDAVNKGNKVYKSVGNDYENFSGTGSDQFTFAETITGLCTNNETLFYFTKSTISATTKGDILESNGQFVYVTGALQTKEGAVNNTSIVTAGNDVYCLTPSNKIIKIARGYSIDGFEIQELSERKYAGISEIMSTLDADQSDSYGHFYPKENLIKWHLKTDGATYNDICIIYDRTKDAFLVDTDKEFYGAATLNLVTYTISHDTYKVYKDEVGTNDDGSAISFTYYTKEFYIADPTYKKVLWETRTLLDIDNVASLVQAIYIDEVSKDSKTFTSSDSGLNEKYILRTKGNLNVIGRKVQFRYTCNTLNAQVILKNIQILVELKPAISNNLS